MHMQLFETFFFKNQVIKTCRQTYKRNLTVDLKHIDMIMTFKS